MLKAPPAPLRCIPGPAAVQAATVPTVPPLLTTGVPVQGTIPAEVIRHLPAEAAALRAEVILLHIVRPAPEAAEVIPLPAEEAAIREDLPEVHPVAVVADLHRVVVLKATAEEDKTLNYRYNPE